MPAAHLVLDSAFAIAPVPRRLFGSFVEHMGRCVYTGIYEPGHPTADANGLRGDVLDLTREIGPTVIRYPGGNFVSNYRWEDGVGPKESRPRRLDLAWHSLETNQFGLHEFMDWAKLAETEPMMAVNLGTRGLQEAADLLEYTNIAGGTYWSDLRKANGATDPFNVKLWCLGNELDGPWQVGHQTAVEYGRLANETGKAMRLIDGDIELVACGSSSAKMPTFGSWESTVLELSYDTVDYVSMHGYYEEYDGDPLSFLASGVSMDHFIDDVVATVDAVRARGGHQKRINISFDEWNVWYIKKYRDQGGSGPKSADTPWPEHPRLIEDEYSVTDAVVVGTLLNSLLRHGDRVTVACQAQLVNVIGLLRSEEGGAAWKQTIAYPFEQMRRLAQGQVLQVVASGDKFDSPDFTDVPVVDASATYDAETGRAALFVANRSLEESATLDVDLRGIGATAVRSASILGAGDQQDRHTTNLENHNAITPTAFTDFTLDAGRLTANLPALSWTVFELDAARG